MESFKINLFNKEIHLDNPIYSEIEISTITQYIESKLSTSNYLDAYERIQTDSHLVSDYNALDSDFSIRDLFKFCHLECSTINIIWNIKDEKFDKMSFLNFSKYFEYIWYPAIDDILICDSIVSFIIFIRHDGTIYYIK